jgi:hypothetical protein
MYIPHPIRDDQGNCAAETCTLSSAECHTRTVEPDPGYRWWEEQAAIMSAKRKQFEEFGAKMTRQRWLTKLKIAHTDEDTPSSQTKGPNTAHLLHF